jgi:hypothetical protein
MGKKNPNGEAVYDFDEDHEEEDRVYASRV